MKFVVAEWKKSCIFAVAYERKVGSCKKSIAKLSFNRNIGKIFKEEDGAFMLSLGVYAIFLSAYRSGVRCMFQDPVPRKVFADSSVKTDMST